MIDTNAFDRTKFTNQPFVKKIAKPWGYEILFSEEDLPYAGKILHLDAGKRISLQLHDEKQETQMLVLGRCMRIADNEQGELVQIEMEPYKGYTVMKGQRHRLQAITDCDVFEVSTPELGTTYRLQDDYKRIDETEQMRTEERKTL